MMWPLILPQNIAQVEWVNISLVVHLIVHSVLLKKQWNSPRMNQLDNTPELFNIENAKNIFVIISSALHTETNYALQILISVPIKQLVAHHNTRRIHHCMHRVW